MKLARLKPYNPRRGQLAKRYMIRGFLFNVERGWYEVSDEFAVELAELTTHDDPDGTKLFDIVSREDAEALQAKEQSNVGPNRVDTAPRVTPRAEPRSKSSSTITTDDVVDDSGGGKLIDPNPDGEDDEDEEPRDDVANVGRIEPIESDTKPKSRGRK